MGTINYHFHHDYFISNFKDLYLYVMPEFSHINVQETTLKSETTDIF